MPLELSAPTNSISNGYLVPSRTGTPGGGFVTRPAEPSTTTTTTTSGGEEYYYVVEMTPTDAAEDPQVGPRMAPVLDDVVVLYAPWSAARVITESEVMDDD